MDKNSEEYEAVLEKLEVMFPGQVADCEELLQALVKLMAACARHSHPSPELTPRLT